MAATTEAGQHTDINLKIIQAELDFLPELAVLWHEEGDVSRDVWRSEWHDLMIRLASLDREHLSGALSEAQVRQYLQLRKTLAKQTAMLRQLGLPLPPPPPSDGVPPTRLTP